MGGRFQYAMDRNVYIYVSTFQYVDQGDAEARPGGGQHNTGGARLAEQRMVRQVDAANDSSSSKDTRERHHVAKSPGKAHPLGKRLRLLGCKLSGIGSETKI